MQIIYISNRTVEMVDTIQHVQKYMKYISDIIILFPPLMINSFKSQLPNLKILCKNELLGSKKGINDEKW